MTRGPTVGSRGNLVGKHTRRGLAVWKSEVACVNDGGARFARDPRDSEYFGFRNGPPPTGAPSKSLFVLLYFWRKGNCKTWIPGTFNDMWVRGKMGPLVRVRTLVLAFRKLLHLFRRLQRKGSEIWDARAGAAGM